MVNDLAAFINTPSPKLNYSDVEMENCLNIIPHSILFDYGIKDYLIEVNTHPQFEKLFFKNSNSQISFDLFGASFWLLTRYEEYLPHKIDKFHRFNFKSSLAYQYSFIEKALVNKWLEELKKILLICYPDLQFKKHSYVFLSSIDVDNVYKYKHKGFVRTIAGYVSDLFSKNFDSIKQRTLVIFKKKKDPFDCYQFLIDTHKQLNIEAIYFFLLGDYGMNDKNHSATNLYFQTLIKEIADYGMVGIHPSYGSQNNLQQLKVEVSRLSSITHKTIRKSRQHFSVLNFPETYNALLQAGVTEDYSMGYTNYNGFRASYCYPFKWYNLEDEQITPLTIYPFCIAENTAIYYANKENKAYSDLVNPLINEVKKYNGLLISIFHNDTFTDEMKKVYLKFLETCINFGQQN
ncbi:MAG: polysaccharide deacetylase family protein [Bacteroidota bacterium]|nr:polysaccharide deacetylase family protein [Bacteroidota bacterium]